MVRREKINATALSLALVVSLIAAVTVLGAAVGTVGAVHPSDAPDLTDEADFTVNFPNAEDHYPDREEEGSIEYFASGADAFAVQDAEDGVFIHYIIVHAEYEGEDWIDYSACSTDNTKSFGIDRGNNNSGTQTDEDLVQRRKDDDFREDGIVVEFFKHTDIGGDPPYMAAEDAIVAAQGEGSIAGPCLTLTDEPGWYRIAGFMNGTVADNGPDEEPSENAKEVSLQLKSNYLYVCECDSEEEARDELGPPPNEQPDPTPTEETGDDGEETPTETAGSDDGSTDDDGTTDDDGSADDDGTTDDDGGADDDGSTDDDGSADDDGSTDDGNGGTPAADGPGFGALAALVALLASALLLYRRH